MPNCALCVRAACSASASTTPPAPTAANARRTSAPGPGGPAPTCRCPTTLPTRVRTAEGPPWPGRCAPRPHQGHSLPHPSTPGVVDHTHVHTCMHAHTYTQNMCTHTLKHACIKMYTQAYMHKHKHMLTHTHTHTQIHAQACTHSHPSLGGSQAPGLILRPPGTPAFCQKLPGRGPR